MRLVTGLCFSGIYVVAESWLNGFATRTNRSRLFALYMVVLYVGLGAAQFLLVLTNPGSSAPFMLVSGLICLAMVPTLLASQMTPEIIVPRGFPIASCTGSRLSASRPLPWQASSAPPYSRSARCMHTSRVWIRRPSRHSWPINIFAGVTTQYPIGALADRWDRRTVMAGVCAVATLAAAGIAAFPRMPHGLFLVLSAVFTGLALTIYSLGISHVNDRLEPAQMVAASSALLLSTAPGPSSGRCWPAA